MNQHEALRMRAEHDTAKSAEQIAAMVREMLPGMGGYNGFLSDPGGWLDHLLADGTEVTEKDHQEARRAIEIITVEAASAGTGAADREQNRLTREDNALVTIDGTPPLFPAHVDRSTGWLCPTFRREIAEDVVRWVNQAAAADPKNQQRAQWVGDAIHFTHPVHAAEEGERYQPEVVAPDEHGRYWIGATSWTWGHPSPEHLAAELGARQSWPATVPWYAHALAAWVTLAERAGVSCDESTHDVQPVVADYDEERTAGAVRIGWHWWLILLTEDGTVRAHHARKAAPRAQPAELAFAAWLRTERGVIGGDVDLTALFDQYRADSGNSRIEAAHRNRHTPVPVLAEGHPITAAGHDVDAQVRP